MTGITIDVHLKEVIMEKFIDVAFDILDHNHTHYDLPGGRGSTKSSFIGLMIPLILIENPNVHAAVFRRVGNTLKTSVVAQIEWGISKLGLDEYFDVRVSPHKLILKTTGQQILFFGMDKPEKVKSAKIAFGYIGVTWFEELDQFAGEQQLRTVLQTTMRGGDKFWNFRSFNPPKSKNNWANEYVASHEDDKDTLVVRSSYLDVIESGHANWLGEQFIIEAEKLKEKNPIAYQNEYLGMATGSGGAIFDNVEELDMTNDMIYGIETTDQFGNTYLVGGFDKIYNGIDWGFAKDPFRFVKMYYDSARHDLYIFDEYSTVRTRNKTVFDILYNEEHKIDVNELVIADSAEMKSVEDFKAYGAYIRGAYKPPESVKYGIKWLQGLNHIYIDKRRCPFTYKEFSTYEYERDKDGNIISEYPDKDNHSIDAVRYALSTIILRRGN